MWFRRIEPARVIPLTIIDYEAYILKNGELKTVNVGLFYSLPFKYTIRIIKNNNDIYTNCDLRKSHHSSFHGQKKRSKPMSAS